VKIRTTLSAFQIATYVGNDPKHRGSKIKPIDDALRTYWRDFDRLRDDNRIAVTAALFIECKNWLKTKAGKSSTKKTLFGEKVNFTLKRRREAITALAEECLDALDALETRRDSDNLLRLRFDRKKVRALGSGLDRPVSKSLSGGYEFERTRWLKTGKTHTYGSSGVQGQLNRTLPKEFGKTGRKKNVDQLSFTEYERIGELCNVGTVQYLKKPERLADLVEIDNNGLLRNASTHALLHPEMKNKLPKTREEMYEQERTSPISNMAVYMYAMDSYGNLFARWEPRRQDLQGHEFFNHSSFNSGREVTCAGRLFAIAGRLMMIDNISGHYKPGRTNIENCVKMLQADGVDLSETLVAVVDSGFLKYFSVERLLQEGSGPDFGQVTGAL
jgi:hypothetical protein